MYQNEGRFSAMFFEERRGNVGWGKKRLLKTTASTHQQVMVLKIEFCWLAQKITQQRLQGPV
jgi:hypothetical protein